MSYMGNLKSLRYRQVAVVLIPAVVAALLSLVTVEQAVAADPCGPTGNKIACENSKPGTPESQWEINGAGDAGLQGFATDISVNVGETIDFKIDTNASAYSIKIYRSGYYNGDGARLISTITPSASLPQHQPQCITDATTELYDCGNWAVSASWTVPATAVSGVYFAHLVDPATGDESHITFIVRDDSSHSDLVFQTSDTTWQAYNTYGGSDFYAGAANGRAYKISYNRPVLTRGTSSGRDFYMANEYPLVRFLEKNGYDVSYISGVDTDRHGSLLTNHKAFLSVGHDEYWSGRQRANVEAARDAGVHLMFLSGNEAYWRTRYEPSADSGHTPYRTLICYKETWGNAKIDPAANEWTGTWRDPRFAAPSTGAGRPENGLTGTMYMSNFSDLAIQVSAAEGKNRLWRNTSVANLSAGAHATLAPHTIGYESNEDLDNGFRPEGLIRLSTTTGAVPQYLQDFGNTVAPGNTTHHLTLYRAASGALVFSAGTIQWTWGLDSVHDSAYGSQAADPRMQQAQVNLLADMGAQPTTLDPSLTAATASTDLTGPTVDITAPVAGATVANGTKVTATGTAADQGGRVAGVEVSTDGGTTWHPAQGTTSWSYTYVQHGVGTTPLRVRAIDDSANIGTAATVSTTVTCPCSIFGDTDPVNPSINDAAAVELGLRFTPTRDGFVSGVRFFKGSGNTGTHVGSLWTSTGQRLAQVTFSDETATGWQQATFTSPVPVTAGQTYLVSYTAPAGHYAAQPFAFSSQGIVADPFEVAGGFSADPAGRYGAPGTFPAQSHQRALYYVDAMFSLTDDSPLVATGQYPWPGSSSVPLDSRVAARFSKPVVASSVDIAVVDSVGAAVPGTTTYDAATRVATFTPNAPMAGMVRHTVTLTAHDAQGNQVSSGGSWSFTTGRTSSAPGVCPCTVFDDMTTPGMLEDPDGSPVTLGMRFSATVDGNVLGIRFYKGPNNTGVHTGTLWRADGTVLATGTFANESTAGWQTLLFPEPVRINKDTVYTVSYRAPNGHPSATVGAFSAQNLSKPPLRVYSDSGAYTYGTGFPGVNSTNSYLVDVVFDRLPPEMSVLASRPAAGAIGIGRRATIDVWFSAAVAAGYTFAVSSGGQPIAGSVSTSEGGTHLTFTPVDPLPRNADVTVTLSGVTSVEGATLPTQQWTFHTADSGNTTAEQTLFGPVVPQTPVVDDSAPIELGTAFRPSVDGQITSIRFFKGSVANGGVHTGSVWNAAGQRLATVTFSDETPSGWQTATLTTPLAVTAGTTYVVSYFAPQGHYSASPGFFTNAWTAGDLTAPAGNNGRYLYAATGGFPAYSFNNTNYFVDVGFQTNPEPLSVTGRSPAPDAIDVARSAAVSISFSASLDPGYSISLRDGNTAIPGSVALNQAANTITFTPDSALPADRLLTVQVQGIVSTQGAQLGDQTWSFRTAPAPAMTIIEQTPAPDATAVARSGPLVVRFSQPVADGYGLTVTAGATAIAGTTTRSTDGQTLTFTPAATLPGDTVVTVALTGIVSTDGATLADTGWSFRTVAPDGIAIASRVPSPDATGVSRSEPVSVTFTQPVADGYQLTVSDGTTAVSGALSRSADGRTLTFTPGATLPPDTQLSVALAGIRSTDGAILADTSWGFRTVAREVLTASMFSGLTPATPAVGSTTATEVGTHFTPSVTGEVTAIRFYKAAANTGTHRVSLWTSTGSRLARVTVTGETASGWQTMQLPTPVRLTAGQSYVVSYNAPVGRYSSTPGFFTTTPHTVGPLTATRANNGRYRATTTAFPNLISTGTNFFVDVVFRYLGP